VDGSTSVTFAAGGVPYPGGSLTLAVFDVGGGPYLDGSSTLPVGYVGKLVMFRVFDVPVGSAVAVTYGKDRPLVGMMMAVAVTVTEKVASAPNSLSGIAVPTPLLVQGDGTDRSEVTGLA
jgi:hypothetical protein